MEIKIDITRITFDDMLEMVGLFSDVDIEDLKKSKTGEIIKKYKPLLSYFVFDGINRITGKEAEALVGGMPAIEVLPKIPVLIEVITKLTGMMTLPPEISGNS